MWIQSNLTNPKWGVVRICVIQKKKYAHVLNVFRILSAYFRFQAAPFHLVCVLTCVQLCLVYFKVCAVCLHVNLVILPGGLGGSVWTRINKCLLYIFTDQHIMLYFQTLTALDTDSDPETLLLFLIIKLQYFIFALYRRRWDTEQHNY